MDVETFQKCNRNYYFTVDLFAPNRNSQCKKFYSNFFCSGTSGIDAFFHSWDGEVAWICTPIREVTRIIRRLQLHECPVCYSFPNGELPTIGLKCLLVAAACYDHLTMSNFVDLLLFRAPMTIVLLLLVEYLSIFLQLNLIHSDWPTSMNVMLNKFTMHCPYNVSLLSLFLQQFWHFNTTRDWEVYILGGHGIQSPPPPPDVWAVYPSHHGPLLLSLRLFFRNVLRIHLHHTPMMSSISSGHRGRRYMAPVCPDSDYFWQYTIAPDIPSNWGPGILNSLTWALRNNVSRRD